MACTQYLLQWHPGVYVLRKIYSTLYERLNTPGGPHPGFLDWKPQRERAWAPATCNTGMEHVLCLAQAACDREIS